MATVLMCHMKNFLLTTFKDLRPNKIYKITMKKKMGKWTQPPCLAIFDETVPGHGCEVSVVDACTPGKSGGMRMHAINALKQKVLGKRYWHVNSLWHSDAIWQLRSGSTLVQLIWFVAWRHQAITWTNVDSSIGYVACTREQFHKKCFGSC